ncbi:MAG: ABC transporter ATP-binding protein/permease [Firmicutes bacterium]|nr:ABC transporter ATP-binding protein/permease [Bacillota bacterium]
MEEKQITLGSLIKRFMPYLTKYKGVLIFDLFCAALTSVCELVFPMLVRYITNMGINNLAGLTLEIIIKIAAFYLILRVIDTAANYYMAYNGHIMGTKIETDMRRDLFAHLEKLSFSYYSEHKVGQIMSRITNDLFDITEFAHHCPEELFIAALKITVSFIVLGNINIWLTLIIFAVLPFMFWVVKYFNTRMRRTFKERRNRLGEINAQVEDSLLGIRVVKSFGNEEIEKEKFERGNIRFYDIKRKSYSYMAGNQTATRFFEGIMYVTVLTAGAIFMINGKVSPADLTAYLLYVGTLLSTIRTILQFTEQFQSGMTGIERFIEIMDAPVEISDAENAVDLGDVKGDIEFKNVSFRYGDDNAEVLSNINMSVEHGKSVAVVGPSGGGKTTMCNLIPRFYDVTGGEILIDGTDIKTVTTRSLRQAVGVVQQEVYLFSGTIYDNILYGKPNASRDEVIQAAKDAGAHEFIMGFEKGYDTYVGERGVKLSGGQKQRISIARVFLKNPPILILDEATSALDNESEYIVQQSLERLAAGRTVLTIAHRLTTIKNSDKIIVLTADGIAEEGTHSALMEKGGIYSQLYKMYLV